MVLKTSSTSSVTLHHGLRSEDFEPCIWCKYFFQEPCGVPKCLHGDSLERVCYLTMRNHEVSCSDYKMRDVNQLSPVDDILEFLF